jgi:hypothetical protein
MIKKRKKKIKKRRVINRSHYQVMVALLINIIGHKL